MLILPIVMAGCSSSPADPNDPDDKVQLTVIVGGGSSVQFYDSQN